MINLLPQNEKKKLAREHRLRLAVVICWALFTLGILSLILFLPSYYMLFVSTRDLRAEISQKKVIVPNGTEDAQREGAMIKQDIAILKPSVDALPSVIISDLLKGKPKGISLNLISYVHTAKNTELQFGGMAATRDDLLEFQKNLKSNVRVADLRYSNTFIIQKTDINFSLSITLK